MDSNRNRFLLIVLVLVAVGLTLGEAMFLFWGREHIMPILWLPILMPAAALWIIVANVLKRSRM